MRRRPDRTEHEQSTSLQRGRMALLYYETDLHNLPGRNVLGVWGDGEIRDTFACPCGGQGIHTCDMAGIVIDKERDRQGRLATCLCRDTRQG